MELELDDTDDTMSILSKSLRYRIREDPLRVVYPPSNQFPDIRKFSDEQLITGAEIADGVYWVYKDEIRYILKIVNRPLYEPRDTDVFQNELENLEYFAGMPNIVQAAGVRVSTNPYATSTGSNRSLVVTGALLEAYPGGSLRQVHVEYRLTEYPWKQWPVRIGTALNRFHKAKKLIWT